MIGPSSGTCLLFTLGVMALSIVLKSVLKSECPGDTSNGVRCLLVVQPKALATAVGKVAGSFQARQGTPRLVVPTCHHSQQAGDVGITVLGDHPVMRQRTGCSPSGW